MSHQDLVSSSPELKEAHTSSDAHSTDADAATGAAGGETHRAVPTSARRSNRLRVLGIAAAILLVVLGLALGLGLGLGLRHKSSSSTQTSSGASGSTGPSLGDLATTNTPNASAAFLSMDMTNDAPTTRTYDFVVEERAGAPDGVQKRMLVVNGANLLPFARGGLLRSASTISKRCRAVPGPDDRSQHGRSRRGEHHEQTVELDVSRISHLRTRCDTLARTVPVRQVRSGAWRGTNYYDGTAAITQCGIPPGESMVYNFTLDGWVGSTWWHAHAGTQYTDGITGALIVHAKNESVPAYDGDLAIQLADLYHGFSPELLNLYFTPGGLEGTPGNEPVPDGGTINGIGQWGAYNSSFFNATLAPNKTYRLRLINTGSFVAMRFSVDGHTLTVVEADGTAVEPVDVAAVSVAVAQRYSVLLRTNASAGAYWMRAALDQDAFTYDNPGVQTEVRGVLRYGVADDVLPDVALLDNPPSLPDGAPGDLDTDDLVPVGGGPAPDATFSVYFTISMQYAGGPNYLSQFLSFINSTSWEPLQGTSTLFSLRANESIADGSATLADSQLITTVDEPHVVEFIIDNLDDGDHPFHLHGHKVRSVTALSLYCVVALPANHGRVIRTRVSERRPYDHKLKYAVVLDRGQRGGTLPEPIAGQQGAYASVEFRSADDRLAWPGCRRDTLVIPAYTYTILRFVADNPGFWAFHCHIQWHMAAGLLFQVNVLPSESAKFDIPQYMLDQCAREGKLM
ncbi:hypothetical protein ONZ51_g5584 [Trametes cubensis]|uniref:laccase n=1 Tax=Trametes cubensis TaxID=1111947 RepID=A0AAD7TW07_9APHY|nr:hypothetical protein ONZ51_g5584 [Trametes cubensis]